MIQNYARKLTLCLYQFSGADHSLQELELPFTAFKVPQRIILAYAQSYQAVKFTMDYYERERFIDILHEFSQGNNFDEAANKVLNISMQTFEKQLLENLKTGFKEVKQPE